MIILEANHIKKMIGDRELFAIEQVRIQSGDRIGLVGRNGSGKTTLFNVLTGVLEADEGAVVTTARHYLLPQLKKTNHLKSGGEVTKGYIDKALAAKPDILFADEPTTNLDIDHIQELEQHLKRFQGAIVLVSHDRSFLDQICNKLWELEDGELTEFNGNYSYYLDQKELLRKQHQGKYEKYVEKKKQLERAKQIKEQKAVKMIKPPSKSMGTSESRIWKMQHATKQKKMHQNIKAIDTRMEKLEKVEKPKELPMVKLDIPNEEAIKGRTVVRVKKLSAGYGDRVLWKDASFAVKGGEKVAIIGKNGSGKTTLLKRILDHPVEVTHSPAAKIGYFSQNLDILNKEISILENVKATAVFPEELIRTVLARLHFLQEDVFKPIEVLSGGERVKVAFAKVFLSDMNVLVMDEPTNYLDIDTVEALEKLLIDYKGTVIFVSHDRRFVGHIATKVIEIEEQNIIEFTGPYQEYLESKQKKGHDDRQDQLLRIETKLTEVIGRLSMEPPSEELEIEYQAVLAERNQLKEKL
ncbi:pleuromutilin/lincosamide/streptogramin A transport system ATP-binding/permease protein [Scopulibacillus darangshiensis]|uniref:Pleuromutilin/lincosamide/streptogramin A transport system ATP-binding/permease protein n=1 Tax=Scopulibacillus darangshiensis TaxID=442528 RepID=A0A4R2P5A1_9BACL|nr:ABC-F type ribosomal protection protein [Scopulibacillus darangshiensis]TCP29952.1 pleuromutilin/lincosamide/streptogramin A transport system ATP-binding/permease protein [Scopulibacillus darangshiensis]